MKNTAIKSVAALAAVIAASSSWAEIVHSVPTTETFETMQESVGPVIVGASDGSFADNWSVFKSVDDSANYGFTGATHFQVGTTADNRNANLGRLKIESGSYTGNCDWTALIGYSATGYVWQTGGLVTINGTLMVGVGNSTSYGYWNMDGGKLVVKGELDIPRDANTHGQMAVTNAEVEVSEGLLVGQAAGQTGALFIGNGATVSTKNFYVGRAANSASLTVTGGSINSKGEFNIGNYGANATFTMTGGTINTGNGPTTGTSANRVAGASYWGTDDNTVSRSFVSGGTLTICDGYDVSIYEHNQWVNHPDEWHIINGKDATCEISVTGSGKVIALANVYFGNGGEEGHASTATITVSDGGELDCGSASMLKWFHFGSNGVCTRTININEGGVFGVSHIENHNGGTININGGTLKCVGTDDNYNAYLLGSYENSDDTLTVTVGEKGAFLDTNGNDVKIKNVVIGGTGTLTLIGGGSVTFDEGATPTCTVVYGTGTWDGTKVPATISLGKNVFLAYDLTSTTTAGETVALAENVNITTEDGSPVAEHVVIRNDGVYWNVSYAANALTATSISALDGDFTIFTGYFNGDYPTDQTKSWVNGRPANNTKIIVPPSTPRMQIYANSVSCGNVVLNGDLTIKGMFRWANLRPAGVTGTGTLHLTASTDEYFYVEADGRSVDVEVPVVLSGYTRITSRPSYPVTFKKDVTVSEGAHCRAQQDNASPVFEDNLTVLGEWINQYGTVMAMGKALSGSGKITGDLDMSAGATLKVGIGDTGVCTNVLTVTGTANLANAAIEIEGGESLADAAIGTEVVLFRAKAISNWTKKTVTIGGKPWKVVVGEETIEETPYQTLKATRTKAGFILIVQ